ncbi:MAG: FAD-dependent oxidoreductase, partial [Betaproteobacteria bacterium]|nr:FAD-dependent oxidoreductase [Betaproteobacteria bacterium]
GGMRFLKTMQNVYGLCSQELGLQVASFDFANNVQYLRDRRFAWADYANPGKVPYDLKGAEAGKDPITLVIDALEALVPGAKGKSGWDLISYLRGARVSDPPLFDKPLYDTGFWSLLMSQLSMEAYHLVQDASGYFSIYNNWSSYGAFLEFMRNYADSQYLKLTQGYQALPLALAEGFQMMGGTVQTHRRLYGLTPQVRGGEPLIRMTLGQPGNPLQWVQYARHVVLALPQRALQLLDPSSFIFDSPQFRDDLDTVTAEPASKLFLSYSEPWWQKLSPPINTGRSDTDLPLRQCYYVGTETAAPHAGMSLLMASYNDGMADSYWDTYLKRSRFGPHHDPYIGKHSGLIDSRLLAPHDMVMEVQRQLTTMHGVPIPAPAAAIYHNWVEDPAGAGWYFWNPHVRSWEVATRIRQPLPGYPVYTCGSCYSENQGWVEGALNTAEMMLESKFDLLRPSWVSPDYYMGP